MSARLQNQYKALALENEKLKADNAALLIAAKVAEKHLDTCAHCHPAEYGVVNKAIAQAEGDK